MGCRVSNTRVQDQIYVIKKNENESIDIAWGLNKLSIILENKVSQNLKLAKMSLRELFIFLKIEQKIISDTEK